MGILNWFTRSSSNTKKPATSRQVQASVLSSVNERENTEYFATAQDKSADAICSEGERRELRAKCRKVYLDFPQAQNCARSLALSCYGSGPSIQIKTPNEELNIAIERLFNKWRKQTRYDEKMFTAIQSLAPDGEAFFSLYEDPSVIGGLNVELIESFRIESPPGTDYSPNEFCGIQFDDNNKPVSYSVQKVSPNPIIYHGLEYDTLPASRVEHLFIPVLAGQKRGLPLFQTSLQTLASLQQIESATLSACQTAARLSFVVESDLDPNADSESQLVGVEGSGGQYEAFDVMSLPSRNAGIYLPSGMRISQLKPEQPSVNFAAFREDCLLGVGASLGAPKNIVLNDSSSYNYSSARLDAQTFERWCSIIQGFCTHILDSHFKSFIASVIDNKDVIELLTIYDSLDDIPVRWYFATPVHIDRQKEAAADQILLQNHCMSLRDYYAKAGKDWRSELQQIALEKKVLQELNLSLEDVKETTIIEEKEDETSNS